MGYKTDGSGLLFRSTFYPQRAEKCSFTCEGPIRGWGGQWQTHRMLPTFYALSCTCILVNPQIHVKWTYWYPRSTHVAIVSELDMPFGTASSVILRLVKCDRILVTALIHNTDKSKAGVKRVGMAGGSPHLPAWPMKQLY